MIPAFPSAALDRTSIGDVKPNTGTSGTTPNTTVSSSFTVKLDETE